MFEAIVLSWAIIDGDTIRVSARVWPNVVVEERVRLLDVDTPELRSRIACERTLALQASAWLNLRLSVAKTITLRAGSRDGFGRVLAYVTADSSLVNQELIAAGIGRPYSLLKQPWC